MARLSEKYIAGFLDSDGSIGIAYRYIGKSRDSSQMRTHVMLSFTQLTRRDEVLHRIQEVIGGSLQYNEERQATCLKLLGKKAEMALARIQKHLVIKRHYAAVVLDIVGNIVDRKETTAFLKAERKRKSLPLPNYPSRKWMAGYLDGDGCFGVRVPKNRTSAQITLEASSSDYDSEGIELIHKAFGGSISRTGNGISNYTLTMPPSKARQVLGHWGKYAIIKKSQADFILGCAKMGHYRDGKSIKASLKQLKAQPHRLSEPGLINEMLENVKDIETAREASRKKWLAGGCGCSAPHYCHSLCRKCYDKQRWAKRQSELAKAS
ncbi:LAGLIDADG family homing endonuclease [Marinobacter salarius]|uniref:LAGLIDADG family homing endonuclease n=1 Tax=Marinobacter salarius TaxID=1420917 RepID=UPI0022B16760|nr:LAGLIDADG family homing endonuclease [Marinobacter salarius]MCZ4284548.1 LAGLIDADG family homing endonuclease [Marinobacter salarius]